MAKLKSNLNVSNSISIKLSTVTNSLGTKIIGNVSKSNITSSSKAGSSGKTHENINKSYDTLLKAEAKHIKSLGTKMKQFDTKLSKGMKK